MISEKEESLNIFLPQHACDGTGTKLYKRRWYILSLYILYAGINAFQWFEYSIITNIIMKFYNINAVSVDWTSIIYMALYMPMVIPASYLMEKKGLRCTAVIGVLGTAIGTTIKIFSLASDRMWVVYLAQTVLSSMQVFILPLPPRIAAVWFGSKEVSLACALGVFGTQLGQTFGFLLPPMIVQDDVDLENIKKDLGQLVWGLALVTVVVTLAVLVYFPECPPSSPRPKSGDEKMEFWATLKKLFGDKGFVFHTLAYGICIAVFVSVSTLLNQFILSHFPNSEEDAGRIGLLMVVLGMMGAVFFGFLLDKTHKYKEITLRLYIMALLGLICFMYALESRSKILAYVTGSFVGLFMNSYMPVGLELAIELTYPEAESTSSGILISFTQTFGVIFTLLLGRLFATIGCFWALGSMAFFLLLGCILTTLIPNTLKRRNAFKHQTK